MALPGDLELRKLGVADVDATTALVARCDDTYLDWAPAGWTPPELDWYRDRWLERLPDPDTWARGAFEPAGRLVGFVAFRSEHDRDAGPVPGVAHVNAVFVDPDRWREGIAAAMLELAEEEMARRGYRSARLWTPENGPACRFYEAQGWHAEGRREWFDQLALHVAGYAKALPAGGGCR